MIPNALLLFLLLIITVMAVVFYFAAHNAHRRHRAYKTALETNQKKLDIQTSRVSILSRALPNLTSLLTDPKSQDTWQTLALDEGRALMWADGASYWKFNEKDHTMELQVGRGLETNLKETKLRFDQEDPLAVVQAAKTRVPVLVSTDEIVSEPQSVLTVPMVVSGTLWGVFRFVRKGDEKVNTRDLDLIAMFVKQLALAVENREMVNNREKFYLELVQTLADILDSRDAAKQGQTQRARRFARGIAEEMDMPEQFIYYLEFAALMHDIGKITIDESLLQKPGKLTPEEFEIIKKHPETGYKILSPVTMLAPVAPMVLYHQEWFNGKGYPEGLSGEEIPLGARIVAVLDAWGAMTCARPWRPALTKDEAIKEIKKGASTQFDPKVVDAFLAVLEKAGPDVI